jgi:hypothetical protein
LHGSRLSFSLSRISQGHREWLGHRDRWSPFLG